jgi:adenine-specific DNA methylase
VRGDKEKWLKYFLSAAEIDFMRQLRRNEAVCELSNFAHVDVGVVTGKNEFFILRSSDLKEKGLGRRSLPVVSRTAHLRGAYLAPNEWSSLSRQDEKVHLLDIRKKSKNALSDAERKYVELGEKTGVHLGYKCSIRKPWFQVPATWVPDGFLFRQIYDFPRLVKNNAGATCTDTIHRFSMKNGNATSLIASTYSHLTAASAEIEGRSYGGGVLELEPTEAERLLVPSKTNASLPLREADALIRQGKLKAVLEENDRRLLREHVGLSATDCRRLKEVWIKLRERRHRRGKTLS